MSESSHARMTESVGEEMTEKAEGSLSELLSLLTSREADAAHKLKLKELLRSFLLTCASGRPVEECFPSSNPHSVSSLLVQQLLHQFSRAFLATPSDPTTSSRHHSTAQPGLDQTSLKDFLREEVILFLLLSIQTIARQVDATYPELAELLLVVIKTLLGREPQFNIDKDTVLDTLPLYTLLGTEAPPTSASGFPSFPVLASEHSTETAGDKHEDDDDLLAPPPILPPSSFSSSSSPTSSPASSPVSTPVQIVPQVVTCKLLEAVTKKERVADDDEAEPLTDQTLHLLLLATLESVATQTGARTTAQVGSTLHLLSELTALYEDVVALWLQLHNQSGQPAAADLTASLSGSVDGGEGGGGGGVSLAAPSSGDGSYQGLVHVARTVLRLWLVLSSQILHSSVTSQQAAEIKPLLCSPVLTISQACYNLRRVGLFRGNECLDHEFTLMILETVLSCLHSANLLALVDTCPVEDVFRVFQDTLSDGCHEWFAYLCSKLQAVAEADSVHLQASSWGRVMEYSYALLTFILRELIVTAEHIKLFEKASKSALSGEVVARPVKYSVELSTGLDKLTKRMSKLANVILDCFKQVSMIQLLALQLLSETASDTVEIIGNFLSNILDPAIRANPEVLDHYLELLVSVWFRLSPDYTGSAGWWKKLSNYFALLHEAKRGTSHQVLYHLQCLFSHESTTLKSQLTHHVVLPLHTHLIAKVREKVYRNRTSSGNTAGHIGRADVEWSADLENSLDEDEKALVVLFLKLLLKAVSHPSSVHAFLTNNTSHLYSLFLLLPVSSFCPPTLSVAEECFKTLQKPAPSSSSSTSSGSGSTNTDTSGTQKTLLKIFLKLGFSMPVDRITDLCLAIADGKILLPTFGIGEVDRVHKRLQDTFETPPLSSLLSPAFINHLSIIANVWEILARLAPHGPLVHTILKDNYIWDVVSNFSPILGSLLSRVQQQIEGGALEADAACVCSLQELAVSLLSNLMSLAHFLCWQRRESKVLELLCKEVHTTLSGSNLCSISNSPLYCTALLKAACCQQQELSAAANTRNFPHSQSRNFHLSPAIGGLTISSSPRSGSSVARTYSRKSSADGENGGGGGGGGGGGRDVLGRSKPIPIQRQEGSRLKRERDSSTTSQNYFPNSTCGVGSATTGHAHTSPYLPQSWSIISGGASYQATAASYRSWVIIPEPTDSELSGYEADVERGSHHNVEVAESCGDMEEEEGNLKEGELLRSLTSYLVPPEVQQRLWILPPIWQCIDLLRENISKGLSPHGEKCVEVYLYQLHALLRADKYNVTLLSGKSLLETLLDAFAPLFSSESERCVTCCRLICRIAEVVAVYQISPSETRKLLLRMQARPVHLEHAAVLLHNVALTTTRSVQLSSFVEFSYPRPHQQLDKHHMLTVPFVMSWGAEPRAISLWFSVSKYPLQAFLHLLSVHTGESYLQVWACACTGDIIIRLSSRLQLDCHTNGDPHTQTLGSVITTGQWHHLIISVLPFSMQPMYKLLVLVDGKDCFTYTLPLPSGPTMGSKWQYHIAGGAVSHHTSERHIQLVNADTSHITWKLGSLHVLKGFTNPALGSLLYDMGPQCASCNQQAIHEVLRRYHFGSTLNPSDDTTIISKPPLSEAEVAQLTEQPFFSYSAQEPMKFFALSAKEGEWSDPTHPLYIPLTDTLQWVMSAHAISRPQLLDVLNSSVGTEQLIYLYAKVVSEGFSEDIQWHAVSLLRLTTQHSLLAQLEFKALEGIGLVQQVLRSPEASVGKKIAEEFIQWCCSAERRAIHNVCVLEHILLDWRIWHRADEEVWKSVLWQLQKLLSPEEAGEALDSNIDCFHKAKAIVKILLTSKERSLERLPALSPNIACHFVRLIELLLGSPPRLDSLRYVCDHLLVCDMNDLKLVAGPAMLETSISVFDGRHASNVDTAPTILSSPLPSVSGSEHLGGETYSLHSPISPSSSTIPIVTAYSNSISDSDTEDMIAFDVQPSEGRLPQSSYTEEDSLFTWTDITGQLAVAEDTDGPGEDIPTSLEVGLLGHVRKVLMLLPDSLVHSVVGRVIQHDCLIAMAHHQDIVVRTAVIRVLDQYFRRASDGMKSNFVQLKGFNLLASQLKQFKVSVQLISALCSLALGQEVNLSKEQLGTFQLPLMMPSFNTHAVIPVIQCTLNTVGQPQLCHATLCTLRELFETVKGMPLFMISNGILKLLCQIIATTCDLTLSRTDKELILTDVLHFCKLIVIFSISADQEEWFRSLENLLVCLRHCCEELLKTRGPHAMSVVYLHRFQYHVLMQALCYFQEDMGPEGAGYVPTLPSATQTPGHSDLTSRFSSTCVLAVDWVVYGAGHFTSDHTHHFLEGVSMPRGMMFESRASIRGVDVGFTRFLMQFFYQSLVPVVRKDMSLSLDRQRYSISSRTQLNEQLSRLLCYMLSTVHDSIVRAAILRQFWTMDDSRYVLNFVLTSTLKKTLGSRLVLTILHLVKHSKAHQQMDSALLDILNDLYELVCRSSATRLKNGTMMSTLLSCTSPGELETRKRQKYEGVLEDMKNMDQRWQERYEYDVKAFAQKQKATYTKLVEKARFRQQAVDRSSAFVTSRIFGMQSELRKSFLEQISLASMHERDNLRQWRRVIQLNTHPRALWSKDECRQMCWQLDPTEGPGRVRRRMMRAPLTVARRYIISETSRGRGGGGAGEREEEEGKDKASSPLSFIFDNTAYSGHEAIFNKIVPQKGESISQTCNWSCSNISPDNCCRGHLIMSNLKCYFVGDEPLGDPNITKVLPCDEDVTMLSWGHSEIVEIHRRRYMLKSDALEIFLISGKTLLLSFESTKVRNLVYSSLLQLDLPNMVDSGEAEMEKLKTITQSWQQGEVTNFEYLMELNKLAGRTFNDLMQYPVFPFIVADYNSTELDLRRAESFRKLRLPISVQDESKVKKYLDTYKFLANERRASAAPGLSSISDKPYHYGSHYSNSGIVLHFLVRLPPFTEMFLAFQSGSFDIADRTFRKMATTWWLSSSESATDVKELVPEFFYLPEFLINTERFDFGECQTGEKVDHVIMPTWAKDNPRLFVLKHRQALESDFVSQNLHEWVDLVFGYKQTGKAAVQAINVFHPATYYGADGIDIESITDPTQQAAMRAMVKTYGQMPLQLFRDPHPTRSKNSMLTSFRIRIGSALRWLSATPPLLKVTSPLFWMHISVLKARFALSGSECDFIGTPGSPDLLFSHEQSVDRVPEKIVVVGSGEVIVTGMQTSYFQSSSPAHSSLLVTWGTWDNSLVVRSTAGDATVIRLHPHPLNRVQCCECVCSGQMIVSGGNAGVVSFWTISNTPTGLSYAGKAVHLRGHDGPINCMVACKPFSIMVTGSADRTCILWDTNRLCYVNSLVGHEGAVSVAATSPTLGDIATVCSSKSHKHAKSSDEVFFLRVWTINGRLVGRVVSRVQIKCLQYTSAPEGVYINVLVGGLANGNIKLWSSWDLTQLREVPCPLTSSYPVLSIGISSVSKELYAGYSNQQLVAWVKPRYEQKEEPEFEHLGLEQYYTMNKMRM